MLAVQPTPDPFGPAVAVLTVLGLGLLGAAVAIHRRGRPRREDPRDRPAALVWPDDEPPPDRRP